METRAERQVRFCPSQFRAAELNGKKYIEGHFHVFGDVYQMFEGASESFDPAAFDETLGNDIRALINHESRLVLGRTTIGTLELRVDSKGLWGRIEINENDVDAMNLWARVQRGDVDQCSIGFEILEERTTIDKATGAVHWTILKVRLWEVSVVTFPAYEQTSVKARAEEYAQIKTRQADAWRERMKARIKKWH